jgi:hypothetical protein
VAWGAIQSAGVVHAGVLVGAALLLLSAVRQAAWLGRADAFIFRSHAFFNEMYRAFGGARMSDREPLPFASLYWVPARVRPAVWAHLRQMDRRMPLGRLVAAALLLLWVVLYSQGYGAMAASLLAVIVLAKNAAPFMLAGPDASPPALHLRLHGVPAWVTIRSFVSLRWTLPIALALTVAALFSATLTLVVVWVLADVALALLCSLVLALSTEHAYRRRFA